MKKDSINSVCPVSEARIAVSPARPEGSGRARHPLSNPSGTFWSGRPMALITVFAAGWQNNAAAAPLVRNEHNGP